METNLRYTASLWPSCSIWSRRGQKNKHTALWVTAAWQPAKPRGLWCWSNTAMAGTTIFSVPMLPSCFIYCRVLYKHSGCGGSIGLCFFFFFSSFLLGWKSAFNCTVVKSSKAKTTYINHVCSQYVAENAVLPHGTAMTVKWQWKNCTHCTGSLKMKLGQQSYGMKVYPLNTPISTVACVDNTS